MKRILAIICSLLLLLSLAACGGNGENLSSTEASPSSSQEETESNASLSEQIQAPVESQLPSSQPQSAPQQAQSQSEDPSSSSEPQFMPQQPQPPQELQTPVSQPTRNTTSEDNAVTKMNVLVGGEIFTATLENNSAVDSFVEMMQNAPVVISMSGYSGFEKVGSLGTSLPTSNSQTTTHAGDIVLYSGNQIVLFYGSNSWSYTRLGKIDDLSGWEQALGTGDVTVTFSLE